MGGKKIRGWDPLDTWHEESMIQHLRAQYDRLCQESIRLWQEGSYCGDIRTTRLAAQKGDLLYRIQQYEAAIHAKRAGGQGVVAYA